MEEILQAKYTDFTNEDVDYPSVGSIKKTGYMPVPRPTIASQGMIEARHRQEEVSVTCVSSQLLSIHLISPCVSLCLLLNPSQHHKKHFIMKKFQNVKGTFQREREAKELAESGGRHYDDDREQY